MNKIFATVAVILCFIQVPVLAQDSRRTKAARQPQSVRSTTTRNASRPPSSSRPAVTSASHEHIVEGDVFYEGEPMVSGGCDSCGGGGCDSCQIGSYCDSCHAPRRLCICFPAHGWVHAEYLTWFQSGMDLPPLVTTSETGTARDAAGVLGLPTTSILYGGGQAMTDDHSGFRIRFGSWFASFPLWGYEGEYTGLGAKTESFFSQSTGSPILARPFFNARDGREDSELVAFPGVISGNVAVDVTNQLDGAAVRFRRQLLCTTGCGYSELCCQTVPTSSRLEATIGYRFWELKESLQVREQLQSQLSTGDSFVLTDRFDTRNQFNGVELGFLWQGRRGWWSLDALMRLGIGNVRQTVTIDGSTVTTEAGVTLPSSAGGLLAQRTNIGTFDRDTFTMVPELGVTLGYQLTKRLRATMGYSLIYWGNTLRPGDQVDLDVNPNLLPPEIAPFTGPLRPQFDFVETDYWVQGLSFGGEFRW